MFRSLLVYIFAMAFVALGLRSAPIYAQDNPSPFTAAILLLRFSSEMKWLGETPRLISATEALQKSPLPTVDLIQFVKQADPCTYERREYVPAPDRYVIMHSVIDFSRVSDQWNSNGPFVAFPGRSSAMCAYLTRVGTNDLSKARAVSYGPAPEGTKITCGSVVSGVAIAPMRTEVLRAMAFIHQHECAAYAAPF